MSEVKDAIYLTGFLVWFFTCWYLNAKLDKIKSRIDALADAIDRNHNPQPEDWGP